MERVIIAPGRGGSADAKRERAEQTRRTLVAEATRLFGANGYYATGTPELVAAAAVTRGALYHHFGSKGELFEAVFVEALRDLNEQARASVSILSHDVWAQLTGALDAYLRLIAERADLRRIVLTDGPIVLGWTRWHILQAEWVEAGIAATLARLHRTGLLSAAAPEPLAVLIQGAVNEAAMAIVHSDHPSHDLPSLTAALRMLLDGLRLSGASEVSQ